MKITFVVGLLITVFLKDSSQQCFPPYASNQPERKTHADLYSGQQGFSLALLNAINKIMPNENLFFSPYSTYHALLIAYFMTGGQTESYLKKVLRLDQSQNKSDIYAAYKTDKFITQVLAKSAPYEFTNANKIYVSDAVPVRDCVVNDFPEELEKKNFKTDAESVRLSINGWVENTTHHMIKDLLPRGTIDETTDLVLVNAAYFKGIWEHKFNPDLTKQEIFYVNPSKQIMVDMMHIEETFKHDVSETLGAHILELPYKGDNISMYILLPPFTNTEDSIEATLKNLTLENFRSVVENDNLISRTVQVALPKFSLETTIELTPVLEYMGVGNLFQPTSDLSVISDEKLSLTDALHKAKIEVNEEGTKAAAATVLFSFRSSRPAEPAQFICNHPFIYIIYEKVQKAVLFAGIFRRPH
ncbi:serine protease inhibitor 88Ea-like isoform X2 [Anoplophora glabripennis]|uniref:serine protease inhibitor 88Ea-like isoform X2 n=1 Tax=Anoplophora glabripennis TaxID=217634 RepID=UPI000874629F|nr:serine protease inhibitor 88Ea-like isoform X2 [Anoplophora glabripennis]